MPQPHDEVVRFVRRKHRGTLVGHGMEQLQVPDPYRLKNTTQGFENALEDQTSPKSEV